MAENATPLAIRIAYTGENLDAVAREIASNMAKAGAQVEEPQPEPPPRAVLGAPEVIVTIVVTAAAKALFKVSLHALRTYLGSRPENVEGQLQVVVEQPGKLSRRFLRSLKTLTGDAVEEFIEEIIDVVA